MRKAIVVAVLVALVLLLAVPVAANAGSSRYQFPKGAKIAVTVGPPDAYGDYPVTFEWPPLQKASPIVYGVRVYSPKAHIWPMQTTTNLSITLPCPPGNWTVVVEAYDGPDTDPSRLGAVIDSLKANFSAP
jgi:hypothetical protein